MKKPISALLLFLFIIFVDVYTSHAQSPDWTNVLQLHTQGLPAVKAVTADVNGIFYACALSAPLTLEGTEYSPAGMTDLLLIKMNHTGSIIWVKKYAGSPECALNADAISLDAGGNIFICSDFSGALTIGSTTLTSGPDYNAFIAKFDAAGNGIWACPFLKTGNWKSKIAIDDTGNSYLISGSTKYMKFSEAGYPLFEYSFPEKTLQAIAIRGNTLYLGGTLHMGTTQFGNLQLTSNLNILSTAYIVKGDFLGNFSLSCMDNRNPISTKAGSYRAVGTFNHPTAGIRTYDLTKDLTGISENKLSTFVGDITNATGLIINIQPDNTVTYDGSTYSGSVPITATSGAENRYDPANQKFYLNYEYAGSSGIRYISESLTYTGPGLNMEGSSVSDIAFDSSGNLILTGAYNQHIYYSPAAYADGAATVCTYIAKCSPELVFSWLHSSSTLMNLYSKDWKFNVFTDQNNQIYEYGPGAGITYGNVTLSVSTVEQFVFSFDPDGNALNGIKLSNTSNERTTVDPLGRLITGSTLTAEGANGYGNILFYEYAPGFSAGYSNHSTQSKAGSAKIRSIKHDTGNNTILQSRVLGYCDFFGTVINTPSSLTIITKLDEQGNLLWLKKIPDLNTYQYGQSFLVDRDNNILTSGLFKASISIDSINLTTPNASSEGYVAKYSPGGKLLWASTLQLNVDIPDVIGLAADKSGNVIACGVLNPENYLIKFSPEGVKTWERVYAMDSYYVAVVSTDGNDNIYLASELHISDNGGSATIGNVTLTQTHDDGATALIKFDPAGNAIWAKTYGGITGASYSDSWPTDIKTLDNGNTYIYGWCPNNATFGATTLTNPFNSNRNYSYYLTKVANNGSVMWAKGIFEKDYSYNYGDLLDLDIAGNAYIGAHFTDDISIEGTQYSPEGNNDFLTAKYISSGSLEWLKTIPADKLIMNALCASSEDVVSYVGEQGINNTLGSFTLDRSSGSNAMIATLGGLGPYLNVSTHNLTVAAPGNSNCSFQVVANVTWNAQSNQAWLTLNKTSGNGNESITLTAEGNTENIPRTATVTVTGTGVPSQTIQVIQDGANGIGEPNAGKLSMYPNPAHEHLFVKLETSLESSNMRLSICDLSGLELISQLIQPGISQVDLGALAKGMYMVKINGSKGVVTRKFVKE